MNEVFRIVVSIEVILIFGSGIFLLLNRRKSMPNALMGSILVLFAHNLFVRWLFWTGFIRAVPFLIHTGAVAVSFISPLLYYYIVNLLKPDEKKKRFAVLHFVPAMAALCWYGIYQAFLRPPVDVYLAAFPHFQYSKIDFSLIVVINMQVFTYLLFSLSTIYTCLKNCPQDSRRHIRTIFLFTLSLTVCLILLMITVQLEVLVARTVVFALFGGHGIFYVLFSIRYPEYTQEVQTISRSCKKNPLNNNQREVMRIVTDLDNLIAREKVYYDPDLTLQTLSRQLHTTVHNLSYVLNEKIGMNFRSFINCHRIQEAQRLLSQNTGQSILEIAFQVGFNSKSTFNAIFRKQTGLSPSEYVKNRDKIDSN